MVTGKVPLESFLVNLRRTSRINSRTPMQWDSSEHGGFTTAAHAWLAENQNYKQINAAQELADPDSIYHFFQAVIELRHTTPAFVYGDYVDLDPANPHVYAYTRSLGKERYLVMLNFFHSSIDYPLPAGLHVQKLVLANEQEQGAGTDTLKLGAWAARIYTF